ncbi:MAG: hypothetical protein J0H34_21500 [Rhizobiales bacterium]|nr:hypothetical protein [Hyphomicrobiales bacterium]
MPTARALKRRGPERSLTLPFIRADGCLEIRQLAPDSALYAGLPWQSDELTNNPVGLVFYR